MSNLHTLIIETLLEWDAESDTSKQAHEMGLVSGGFNRWVDPKTGETVAKTVNGQLVKLEPKSPNIAKPNTTQPNTPSINQPAQPNTNVAQPKKNNYWASRKQQEKELLQRAAAISPEALNTMKNAIWARNNPDAARSREIKQHFDRRKRDPEYNKKFEPVDTSFDW